MRKEQSKVVSFLAVLALLAALPPLQAQSSDAALELSRPLRSWEFLPVVGTRAALFGNEAGDFEAWVYPLKILRDFHLIFYTDGRALPAASLARTLVVHPECAIITYASDTFQVKETLFVPVHEAGAVITLQVTSAQAIAIEAGFRRDFQLEWPASLGGTYVQWDPALRAFYFGEEQKKFAAYVGSPSGVLGEEEYATNYSSSPTSSLLLGPIQKGTETKVIVIAGSVQGQADAASTYKRLSSVHADLLRASSDYYRQYLANTVQLRLPDSELQQAYDWARISMVQGLVTNPFLGTGLVAGYRTSGDGQRPGFAWFFGRDALWSDLALDAEGDFTTARSTLEFLAKYQREDGKIPHEISQSASLVPWFSAFPYGYASVDATPLYIIAANDYVTRSGDIAFARQHWDAIWKAYEFLRSTYDPRGLPQNFGFGHGWVEGGPLLPVKTELYQSGVSSEAVRALANLAHLIGKDDLSRDLMERFQRSKRILNDVFWSAGSNVFSFALDQGDKQVEIPTVLSTVPMWFDLLDENKTQSTINLLADFDHQSDWGMRIISSKDARYNPGGYHFGSVWPLFTGWAAVGEYHYHRALPGYSNLRANALLTLDGSLGHVTEVLSGDYFEPLSTSSPHQIWSAAMVVSPLLRGMLGITTDAATHLISVSPHFPYNWSAVSIDNLKVGDCVVSAQYQRTPDGIELRVQRSDSGPCTFEFSPGASLHAKFIGAEINGHKSQVRTSRNSIDQHGTILFPLTAGMNVVHIRIQNDFGLFLDSHLPLPGSASQGLRFVSEAWSSDGKAETFEVAGVAGQTYTLGVWNAEEIVRVNGADLEKSGPHPHLRITFAENGSHEYMKQKVEVHFKR